MKRITCSVLALVLAIFTGLNAKADLVYDLAGDWSTTSDPGANWSYGSYTTSGDPSTFTTTGQYNSGSSTENSWQFAANSDPNIEKNLTSSVITQGPPDEVAWQPGTVAFGPFNGSGTTPGGEVARFTTTAASVYDITVTFQTVQMRGVESDGTTGYLYINGVLINDTGALQDPGEAQTGTSVTLMDTVSLTVGETVDFQVTGGAFTTQVDASLSAVPEPSQYGLGIFLAAMGFVAWRRFSVRPASR